MTDKVCNDPSSEPEDNEHSFIDSIAQDLKVDMIAAEYVLSMGADYNYVRAMEYPVDMFLDLRLSNSDTMYNSAISTSPLIHPHFTPTLKKNGQRFITSSRFLFEIPRHEKHQNTQ